MPPSPFSFSTALFLIKFSVYDAGDGSEPKSSRAPSTASAPSWQVLDQKRPGQKACSTLPPSSQPRRRLQAGGRRPPLRRLSRPEAIGHRMVCGAPSLQHNQRVTPEMIDEMERFKDLAPLHTPIGAYIMREACASFPAFPTSPARLLLPSHHAPSRNPHAHPAEYSPWACAASAFTASPTSPSSTSCSPTCPKSSSSPISATAHPSPPSAMANASTPPWASPHGGIVSGSRTGDIDPGVLLFHPAQDRRNYPQRHEAADQLEVVVSKRAGLVGVSDRSNDMRDLRDAIRDGDQKARLAVNLFTWTVAKCIGGYVAELNGLDMLVFTGASAKRHRFPRRNLLGPHRPGHRPRPHPQQRPRPSRHLRRELTRHRARHPPAEDLVIVNHVVHLLSGRDSPSPSRQACSSQLARLNPRLGAPCLDFQTWETTNPTVLSRNYARPWVPHPFRALCGMGGKPRTPAAKNSYS